MSITPSQAQNGFQSAMILVNTLGTTNGSIQLTSCKTDVLKDSTYYLSFWMKGSANNLGFNAITSFASPPYIRLFLQIVLLPMTNGQNIVTLFLMTQLL